MLSCIASKLFKNCTAISRGNIDTENLFHQANLQYLVELSPVILHLGEAGLRLLTRYKSSPVQEGDLCVPAVLAIYIA